MNEKEGEDWCSNTCLHISSISFNVKANKFTVKLTKPQFVHPILKPRENVKLCKP